MDHRIAASQIYCWMQTLSQQGEKIDDHWDEVLDGTRDAGYPALEPFLAVVQTDELAAAFSAKLKARGLTACSFYTGGVLHEEGLAAATVAQILAGAKNAAQLGAQGLSMNPDPIGRQKTDPELATQAIWLNRLGAGLGELGLGLWVHCHTPEMANDGRELKHNLDATDPALVGFCADLDWIRRGGGDPYAYLDRYADRTGVMHLRSSRGGVWSETFGAGDINHRCVRDTLDTAGFDGPFIVELALEEGTPHTQSLVESLRQSRHYLREVFGV